MKKSFLKALILLLVVFMTISCAGKKPAQKPTPLAGHTILNEKLQSGEYQQKADSFLVILDSSGTMQDSYKGKAKMARAKDFVRRLDQTIPDIDLTGGMRTLGQYFNDSTRLVYGMKSYTRGDLSKATTKLNVGGMTPLGSAIKAGTGDLKTARGNLAVIVVSDGLDTDKMSVKSAKAMKARYGDRVCIYTVLTGDAAGAKDRMLQIARAVGCGFES